MSWITVGATDIHYQEYGESDAPVLVFVHGNNSCSEGWHQQIEAYKTGYHVYAYDSVNHGLTSNSPRDQVEPDRAAELQGFLEAMGISDPVVVGHSMGGGTVLRWTTQHAGAAKAVIICGSGVAPLPQPGQPAPQPAALDPLPYEELTVPTGDYYSERFKAEEPLKFQRYLRLRSTATRLEALRHPRRRHQPSVTGAAFEAQVKAIATPMLVLVGAEDAAARFARHLHELVGHSELLEFPGMKHNFFFEIADQFVAAMDGFLERTGLPVSASKVVVTV